MKGKNEIRNVVICKYDQDKTKVFVFTKDGRVKERPYDEIKEDLEKILEPKIQNLIKNDIELQDDIKKLEEAKSVAAKYGNDSLQEQLELQAKEIEQLARRRAIQSLINTDTFFGVSMFSRFKIGVILIFLFLIIELMYISSHQNLLLKPSIFFSVSNLIYNPCPTI